MNNTMLKWFANLNKMTKFLENILPKSHKLEDLNCYVFVFKIEFRVKNLLTSVGCHHWSFPGEIWNRPCPRKAGRDRETGGHRGWWGSRCPEPGNMHRGLVLGSSRWAFCPTPKSEIFYRSVKWAQSLDPLDGLSCTSQSSLCPWAASGRSEGKWDSHSSNRGEVRSHRPPRSCSRVSWQSRSPGDLLQQQQKTLQVWMASLVTYSKYLMKM